MKKISAMLESPSQSQHLIGHKPALELFEKAFKKGSVPHAWLISGPLGIGKETFAFHCVKSLLKITPGSSAEKRFLAGTHEGIMEIRREEDENGIPKKRDISVEDVRRLNHFFQQTTDSGVWRAALIDGAENLSVSASNALLKLIEEPPPRTVFFLITSRLGAISETIRSRCHLLKLLPLSEMEMRQCLPKADDRILRYAKGSPRVAMLLLQDKYAGLPAYIESLIAGNKPQGEKDIMSELSQGAGMSLFYMLLGEGLVLKSRKAAEAQQYELAHSLAGKYFTLQKLLLDGERFSLEKEQILIESLALLQ